MGVKRGIGHYFLTYFDTSNIFCKKFTKKSHVTSKISSLEHSFTSSLSVGIICKVAKLKYNSFVTSLERADKKTGWVGKKIIVHLSISVT